MQGQGPAPQLEMDVARLEKEIELYSQEKLCFEAQILRVYFCLTLFMIRFMSINYSFLIYIKKKRL